MRNSLNSAFAPVRCATREGGGPAKPEAYNPNIHSASGLHCGPPLDITLSASSLNAPFNVNRPDLNGSPAILGAVGPGKKYFDVTKFSQPAPGRFGTTGRNILSGPGLATLDFSLFRKFPITERIHLELRMESFNFTNTPHFNAPNSNFSSSGFGEVTDAQQDQRQFQIGLRLLF